MAEPNSSSLQKPLVYDLLSRLNASFARVHRNVALLEQSGIFDAQTITRLQRRSEELQADANFHLLGTLREVEMQNLKRHTHAQ